MNEIVLVFDFQIRKNKNASYKSSRLEVFCKKGGLRNLTKIYRKTPVSKSLF